MIELLRLRNFHTGNEFKAYEVFGCHKISDTEYIFRVWAPHAKEVSVVGGFCGEAVMSRLADGESFEVILAAKAGDCYRYKISTEDGRELFKADPYAFASDIPHSFDSVVSDLPEPAKNTSFASGEEQPVNIYEVSLLSWKRHKDNSYYSFDDLSKTLVPYVKRMGYTHVEFMPVTEYPYDGSWGYQVTGYFSVIARLGGLFQFRKLVDKFHENGIKVILDWVPAHFPKDEWGLYEFDGQPLYECPLWDRMEHLDWGTRKFDFGRAEIGCFLISSAVFLFDIFGLDGLRVDAVASMLYLDYDKPHGDWTPNVYGDNRNLEGVEFIKKLNTAVKNLFPDVLMIAEESTAFNGVTKSVEEGGLGFNYKWNMGWMNDVLFYCRQDPYFRNHHHNKITFSLVYAFSEKYVLPLSHDEVVHVKGSIVNKMPGEYADKFAGERALLAFMYAHPGKKLNFMGYEIAQFAEWNYNGAIEFFLKKFEKHRKMACFVKELNFFYRNNRPLYEVEYSWDGFEWLVVDDRFNNLLAFNRYSKNGESITAIINFSGVDLKRYPVAIAQGEYRVVFNTDSVKYGGDGKTRKRVFKTVKHSGGNKEYTLYVDIPKLACVYLKKIK